jgi:hypothetical protein
MDCCKLGPSFLDAKPKKQTTHQSQRMSEQTCHLPWYPLRSLHDFKEGVVTLTRNDPFIIFIYYVSLSSLATHELLTLMAAILQPMSYLASDQPGTATEGFFFRFLAVYAASRCRSVTPQHESAILWCDHIVVSECRGYQWDIIGCEVHNIIAWQNHVGSAWIQKNLKTDWLTILSRAWRHEVNFWSTCQ